MAEKVTIARPYAEAAFQLACDENSLQSWADALQRLALVAADNNAQECITNPLLSDEQVASLLTSATKSTLTAEQQNFVQVLAQNGRALLLPEIYDLFLALKNEHEGVRDAVVTSAFPMDQASLARLSADLEERFKTKLNITLKTDPELIGGVRVMIGDEVIDASVRGKLAAMAAALQN